MEVAIKAEKINMRISRDALKQLREAASLNQQDLTSFVLGAALAQARKVMIEHKTLELSEDEWQNLQAILEDETPLAPEIAARFARAQGAKSRLTA
jgi:uncharacterized protein (DUF1778 family)